LHLVRLCKTDKLEKVNICSKNVASCKAVQN
jgi:hypothetical protein